MLQNNWFSNILGKDWGIIFKFQSNASYQHMKGLDSSSLLIVREDCNISSFTCIGKIEFISGQFVVTIIIHTIAVRI